MSEDAVLPGAALAAPEAAHPWRWSPPRDTWLIRLFDHRGFLAALRLFPAAALLLVFLTYPLGLGLWLAFTDARIGRVGVWAGATHEISCRYCTGLTGYPARSLSM